MASSDFLNAEAAGKLLGISGRQVRNLISDGILPAEKVGSYHLIRKSDLSKVPKDRKPGPKPKTQK